VSDADSLKGFVGERCRIPVLSLKGFVSDMGSAGGLSIQYSLQFNMIIYIHIQYSPSWNDAEQKGMDQGRGKKSRAATAPTLVPLRRLEGSPTRSSFGDYSCHYVSLLLTDAVAEQELRRLRKKTMIALDESGPKFDWKEIDNNSRVIVTIPVSLLLTDAVTEQELRRLRKKTMIALEECGPKFDWKKIDNALTTHAMKSEFD
jgi:hypothetical protein